MRFALTLLIAVAVAAPAAAAPQLVGTDGTGPARLLDADLQPVPGSPKFPRTIYGTVLSPNAKRVATWSFDPGTITIRDAATGAAQRTLKSEVGEDVYWPTRYHVLTVNWDPGDGYDKTPIRVRSYDLKQGTATVTKLPGHPLDQERHGNIVRMLTAGGADYSFPQDGFTVYDIGAAGKIRRTVKLQLPEGMNTYATASLHDDRVLVAQKDKHAIIGLDGTTTPVSLPDGGWSGLGDHFVTDYERAATLDWATGAVGPLVDLPDEPLTLYDGGFITGLGQQRYDADLNKVAENPAVDSRADFFSAEVANDRLYAFTHDCSAAHYAYGMRIVDAATGNAVATKPGGGWNVGVYGGGYMRLHSYDDDCD